MFSMPINRATSSALARLEEFKRELKNLDGLSVKDAKNMPHPTKLSEWTRLGYYEIDADKGVFRLTKQGRSVSA